MLLSHCSLLNWARSEVCSCEDRKADNLQIPKYHILCILSIVCYMLKRSILKMGMLSTDQWSTGIHLSLQPVQSLTELYECVRTQGFPFHQTKRNLCAMVCENNTERESHMTLMAITLLVIWQCLTVWIFM